MKLNDDWKPKQTRQAKIRWWGWLIFIFYCISLWIAYETH
jgi:hypothetical protein